MKAIKFMADANFDRRIVQGLLRRVRDLDIITAQELGLTEASDEVILERAAAEGRVLLTHDEASIPPLAFERLWRGLPMSGVAIVPQDLPIGRAISDLEMLVVASSPEELENRVVWLPL